jgi:hypothetical protein
MIQRYTSLSHLCVLLVLIGMLTAQSTAQTVNVKIRCNTSTCLDTLQTTHIVGIGGDSKKGTAGIDWNAKLYLTNVGGDYWETTIPAIIGDTIHYQFVTKYNDSTFSKVNWGWDGPVNNGFDGGTLRVLLVGSSDTTLPLQYYNGWTTQVGQYDKPFAVKQDTIAVYIRVNMGGVAAFDPGTQTATIYGGTPLGTGSWPKIIDLTREVNSINGGSMWSGTAYVARDSITAGAQQEFKFVYEPPQSWESTANRSFIFSDSVINIAGDTTIHWNYFNDKAPSGSLITSDVLFRLKLQALENAGLFNRTLGDRVGVTGAKGWVVDPFDFDTDPLMLKMTYNTTLEEWNLVESFTLYPNDQIVYKYYVAWDSSRVDTLSANYIPGLALSNGWEEPGVTGGADRKYTFTDVIGQIIPGDFGADQQFFNSIHPYGAIATPVTVTFSINMTPATELATNPTNPLFRPGTDSVFISFDGCFVPITQGKTMYGEDNRIELLDGNGDLIYTGSIVLVAPTLYQLCYRVTYAYRPDVDVTNGGGILAGRRYYQYIRPTQVQAGGVITWPSSFTLPTMDWKVGDLTIEDPPDLETPDGVKAADPNIPGSYALLQNYPNPFNPSTMVSYTIPEKAHVQIDIFNLLGQKIASLVNQEQNAGTHSVAWNSQDDHNQKVSSGVYFLKMQAGSFSQVKKMMLMK